MQDGRCEGCDRSIESTKCIPQTKFPPLECSSEGQIALCAVVSPPAISPVLNPAALSIHWPVLSGSPVPQTGSAHCSPVSASERDKNSTLCTMSRWLLLDCPLPTLCLLQVADFLCEVDDDDELAITPREV